jgi:type 2 lantibiotic biosynthesis protein LanM
VSGLEGRDFLAPAAVSDLSGGLVRHLAFIANRVLGQDFYNYRRAAAPLSAFTVAWAAGPRSFAIHDAYLTALANGRLRTLLRQYPVLGRLIEQSVLQWMAFAEDLCAAIGRDIEDLHRKFSAGPVPRARAVERLRFGLSDRHNGGRTAVRVDFTAGHRAIYKPRSVAGEIAFSELVLWFNSRTGDRRLRETWSLDRGSYGWMEWVPNDASNTADEVRDFYHRFGRILALAYVAGVSDLHRENVIACGDQPVAIDLETVLTYGPRERDWSVAGTGILPRTIAPSLPDIDRSGLTGEVFEDVDEAHAWTAIGTDQMSVGPGLRRLTFAGHRVRTISGYQDASAFRDAFVAGFVDGYDRLLDGRAELAGSDSVAAAMDKVEPRVLVRDTATYAALHTAILAPEFLHEEADRAVELEWLARPIAATRTPSPLRSALYRSELRAMQSLDIPRFTAAQFSTLLSRSKDRPMMALLRPRSSRGFKSQLRRLSEADRDRQAAAVLQAIEARFSQA